jgi:transcriptional regulator with XRE-family HTH domain
MGTQKNIVAKRVRQTRLAVHLTQDQLAGKMARRGIYIDRAGIAKIETGIRRVCDYELKGLAAALGVTMEQLVSG